MRPHTVMFGTSILLVFTTLLFGITEQFERASFSITMAFVAGLLGVGMRVSDRRHASELKADIKDVSPK